MSEASIAFADADADRVAPPLPLAGEGWGEGERRRLLIIFFAAAYPHPAALRASTFSRKWEKGLGCCAAYVDTAFASANERRIAPLSRLRERAGVRASDAEVQSFSPPRTLIQRVVPFSRKREKDVAAVGDRGYSAPPANLG